QGDAAMIWPTALVLAWGLAGLRDDCRAVRPTLSHCGALQSDGQSGLFLTYAMASSRSFCTSTPGRCAISIIRLASAVRTSDAIATFGPLGKNLTTPFGAPSLGRFSVWYTSPRLRTCNESACHSQSG